MIPLSYAQQRLWFIHRLYGPQPMYTMAFAVTLHGRLDVEALGAAFRDVVTRHHVLRTVFPDLDGQPYQRILDPDTVAEMVRTVTPPDQLATAMQTASRRTFAIDSAPPLTLTLHTVGADWHVLHMAWHHIIGDGWSMRPLLADLATAYTARRDQRAPGWAELPVQYADYTLWQRELLNSQVLTDGVGFWRNQLAGLPEEITLPRDRPRPAEPTYRGALHTFRIDAQTHTRLRALARQTHTTMFMILQAAVAILLSRHGAGTDVVLGTAVAGRGDEALEDLVGLFVNTVVLRTDLGGGPSIRALLDRIRRVDLNCFHHQEVPFEKLVEVLNPARSANRHPLFQVMLMLQNAAEARPQFADLRAEVASIDVRAAKFDLSFAFKEIESGTVGIDGDIEYATEMFDAGTVADLAAALTVLLERMCDDPDQSADQIDVLPETHRRRVVEEFNATSRPPAPRVLDEIAAATAAYPDAVAVECGDHLLTYAQLDSRVAALANDLADRGARPGTTVGILLDRGNDLVATLLAVLRVGATYLPLDPSYPSDRIDYMLSDAGPITVVTHRSLLAGPGGSHHRADRMVLDDPVVAPARADTPPATIDVRTTEPAYVIYTSGSTGRPKGVVVPRQGLDNVLRAVSERVPLEPGDRFLATTTVCFDIAVTELFAPLMRGATVVVAPDGLTRDQPALLAEIPRAGITHLQATPSLWQTLADIDVTALTGLTLLSCGEALPAPLTRYLARYAADIVNYYGPTETTVYATVASGGPDIGRPLALTRAYVLDHRLAPAPIGVTGELYLAGTGMAWGYLGRPELTAERFVADPFGPPGGRMYRTGDLAQWARNGTLRYLGRTDHQIKLRGFRVELGEIEAVLAEQPGIGQAAVTLDTQRQILQGFVVPTAENPAPDTDALRHALRQVLPDHMVPTAITVLDRLPTTANGKLDRGRLPTVAPVPSSRRGPRNAVERLLCTAVAEALGLPTVGVEDNLFDLGAHSLMLTALAASIRRRGGPELPIAAFFDHPRIAELADIAAGMPIARTAPRDTERWTRQRRARPGAPFSLYVFPHAGGSAGEYVRWADDLPDVDLWAVQPPGHGDRHREPPLRSLKALVDGIVDNCAFTVPFVLFGHSLGALVAYEVAQALREQDRQGPRLLVVSAARPPDAQLPVPTVPDGAALLDHPGLKAAVPGADRLLRDALADAYAADLEAFTGYRPRSPTPLDCPILTVTGTADTAAREAMHGWAAFSHGHTIHRELPGDHFYFRPDRLPLMRLLSGEIAGPARASVDGP